MQEDVSGSSLKSETGRSKSRSSIKSGELQGLFWKLQIFFLVFLDTAAVCKNNVSLRKTKGLSKIDEEDPETVSQF